MDATTLLVTSLVNFIWLYTILIFARILLSWLQGEGWAQQAMAFLSPVTDPYLNVFRSFIPPLGGIDFSPMLALFVLSTVARVLGGAV
ncbi:putative integral membrane protein [Rubidibacter lacunae KORDI 51-2]|uniref:Putative integral membrane protein n=1 Tax=Rubidibacter lacunae KORDI 51-2 TaxID=582515 RepID=U5DKR4_9CHRO|nr:YggT family protein [Rubidibacter lacunae]ERN40315.1 putative integral membrane protein [Rubidibacter lacunae KORDI 51-2]